MNAKEFLKSLYGENANEVFYRCCESVPYKAIKLSEAAAKLEDDINEFSEFLFDYAALDRNTANSRARQYAYKLWKNDKLLVR